MIGAPLLLTMLLVITMGVPASAQSPGPSGAIEPVAFPIFGLGRVGYALPTWRRADWNGPFAFVVPGTDIDAASYTIVVPGPGRSLDDRVASRVDELRNDMRHATEPTVEMLDTPGGPVGRVIRRVTGEPAGIEGSYLFPTCPDGTALEAWFMQPTSDPDAAAAALAAWDSIATKVVPCHADLRLVRDGGPVTGTAARLSKLLRDWTHRQIDQWAAFRDLVTGGGMDLKQLRARAVAIRDAIARIDRQERAKLAALFPGPFAAPAMVVASATAGLDVPALLDRLGQPRTRADVDAMERVAEEGFGLWVGAMQEAFRSLGLGDPANFPRES